MKIGLIDVGGGLRDIYGAGILDKCLEDGVSFSYCIGVSAGSANIASYLAGQRKRNFRFYLDYAFRKEYMSLRNLLKKGSYVDLRYIYGELARQGGENPLDFQALMRNPAEMVTVASDGESGEALYFTKADLQQDQYDPLMASSCIPVFCRPYPIGGRLCFDGALSDPVPVQRALADGCDKVVVILTRPRQVPRSGEQDRLLARFLRRRYPRAAENLCLRAERYNRGVAMAAELEKQGRALILSPGDIFGLTTLKRDKGALCRLYAQGYRDGRKIHSFFQ